MLESVAFRSRLGVESMWAMGWSIVSWEDEAGAAGGLREQTRVLVDDLSHLRVMVMGCGLSRLRLDIV